jgi:hypothetical protein
MTAQPIPFEVSAPAKNIPEGMRQAILKGLSKDRDLRPATAREFFAELSDGGRMTVAGNPAETAAVARTGTAAMEAVPAFAASGPAHGASMPGQHLPSPTPMAIAAAPVPAAPPRQSGGGGGKGLVIGLVAVGAILLGAIVIVVVKSNKPGNEDLPPLALDTAPAGASSEGPGPVHLDPVDPTPPDASPSTGGSTGAATGGGPATADTGKPVTGGTVTPKGTTGSSGTTTPKGDPCDACNASAASGNASGVASALGRCTDEGKKAACKATLQRNVAGVVRSASLLGQCDRAKGIVAAANSIGVKGAERGLAGACK